MLRTGHGSGAPGGGVLGAGAGGRLLGGIPRATTLCVVGCLVLACLAVMATNYIAYMRAADCVKGGDTVAPPPPWGTFAARWRRLPGQRVPGGPATQAGPPPANANAQSSGGKGEDSDNSAWVPPRRALWRPRGRWRGRRAADDDISSDSSSTTTTASSRSSSSSSGSSSSDRGNDPQPPERPRLRGRGRGGGARRPRRRGGQGEGGAGGGGAPPAPGAAAEPLTTPLPLPTPTVSPSIAPSPSQSPSLAPSPVPPKYMAATPTMVTPLPRRRIILTISTGHTGTMWLVRVLRCTAHPVVAEHEPKPALVSFHEVLLSGRNATYERRVAEKLPIFIAALNNATALTEGAIYAEISHMFIKSWADVFLGWLAVADPSGTRFDVDVIVLRRYLPVVLRSYLTDKSWDPGQRILSWSGGEYLLFHTHQALLPPLAPLTAHDSVDLVLGYLVDMEAQYLRFRRAHPEFRYIEYRAEELFTASGATRLHAVLGTLPVTYRCMQILQTARPVNQHVSWKGPTLLPLSLDIFLARSLQFIAKYRAAGVELPPLPQLLEVAPCPGATFAEPWCEQPLPAWASSPAAIAAILENVTIPHNLPPTNASAVLPATPGSIVK